MYNDKIIGRVAKQDSVYVYMVTDEGTVESAMKYIQCFKKYGTKTNERIIYLRRECFRAVTLTTGTGIWVAGLFSLQDSILSAKIKP
jgi:hypothetical protein